MKRKVRAKGKGIAVFPMVLLAMPILTLALALLGAKLILSGSIGESSMGMCAGVITAVISFILSLYCAIRAPIKKLLWGLSASAAYFLMLLLGNLLFFGINYSHIWLIAACVFGGGLLGSLLGRKKPRKYA